MGYVEIKAEGGAGRVQLGMTGEASVEAYDIDRVGQDDGLDRRPDATFRVLLQLGRGYMIHLYVVAAMQPGRSGWLHSFWTKDCAVYEVDREEHGAPALVRLEPFALPSLFGAFVLENAALTGQPRRFAVLGATLEVRIDADVHLVEMRWRLEGDAELAWSVPSRWRLREQGAWRPLVEGERVTFGEPKGRVQ